MFMLNGETPAAHSMDQIQPARTVAMHVISSQWAGINQTIVLQAILISTVEILSDRETLQLK